MAEDLTCGSCRLPAAVVPELYKIVLHPNLQTHVFDGVCKITFQVKQATKSISLNSAECQIKSTILYSANVVGGVNVIHTLHSDAERLELTFAEELAPGAYGALLN
jgi:hypothetical protein